MITLFATGLDEFGNEMIGSFGCGLDFVRASPTSITPSHRGECVP
jgi:hypothetical protein